MQPEVYTQCILPHPLLQPYVRRFVIRKFDTGDCEFPKPMIADHEMTITFFLHCKLFEFTPFNKDIIPYTVNKHGIAECCFAGIQTSTKGFVVYKGPTTLLTIHFKPTGFFHIFYISPKEIVDKMGDSKNILSNEILLLHEQMQELNKISDCVILLENFLIKKLISQKPCYKHTGISEASDFLINKKGMYCIKQLASDYNMTVQTLEVQFTEQVGIDPKYFSRILRFNTAVNTKLYNPLKSWTDIAYTLGYYDQAHLIKDFKEFTLLSPRNFMITIHPPFENFQENPDDGLICIKNKEQTLILLLRQHIPLKIFPHFIKIAARFFPLLKPFVQFLLAFITCFTKKFTDKFAILLIGRTIIHLFRFAFMLYIRFGNLFFHYFPQSHFFIIRSIRQP